MLESLVRNGNGTALCMPITYAPAPVHSGTSILELSSFQKTGREVICSPAESPRLPEGHVTAHTGIGRRGLLGGELRAEVLLDRQDLFLCKRLGRELTCSRTKAFKN